MSENYEKGVYQRYQIYNEQLFSKFKQVRLY
jgi:hypothetical protein